MPVKRIYRIFFLLIFIVAVWWVIGVTPFVNAIYVPYIYPAVHYGITRITYVFPFSVGEVLYAACVVFIIVYGLRYIKTLANWRGWLAMLEKMMFAGCIAYLVFLFMWGMNYYRQPVYEHYNVLSESPTALDYEDAVNVMSHQADSLWQIAKDTGDYMLCLNKADWKVYTPRISDVKVKASIIPAMDDLLGIDGYFNPFSGEGHVQTRLPAIMLPFVKAHEAAHVYGIAGEDDANWCAYKAGINAPYNTLSASTAFNVMLYLLHNLRVADTIRYRKVMHNLPPRINAELKEVRAYYAHHRGPADGFMRGIFNGYLKFNGQRKGVEAYNSIADWTVADLKNRQVLKTQ